VNFKSCKLKVLDTAMDKNPGFCTKSHIIIWLLVPFFQGGKMNGIHWLSCSCLHSLKCVRRMQWFCLSGIIKRIMNAKIQFKICLWVILWLLIVLQGK